jgi:hypothetical protein
MNESQKLPNNCDSYPQYRLINLDNERVELKILAMLLNTYLEMVKLKSVSPGESSHMLAHHTEFIKRQIAVLLKDLSK